MGKKTEQKAIAALLLVGLLGIIPVLGAQETQAEDEAAVESEPVAPVEAAPGSEPEAAAPEPENASESDDPAGEDAADQDVALEAATDEPVLYGEDEDDGFVLDRFEARRTYQDYLRNNQLDQAVDVAAVALELTEDDLGPWDLELVPILNELGSSLDRLGRPAEAVSHFRRSVTILETPCFPRSRSRPSRRARDHRRTSRAQDFASCGNHDCPRARRIYN